MKLLHTSDWHVGKKLGRFDRMDEYRAVLAEVAGLAEQESADLVLVSGDLFDRPLPPVDALQAVLTALVALTGGGRRPVVAVAGNHDSPDFLEALAPFLAPASIHLIGHVKAPAAGGVLELDTPGGRALVAGFPFLREGRVVDFMADTGDWYQDYAHRVRRLCEEYAAHLSREAGGDAVTVLVAHFMVTGARIRAGAPRGERELHIGEAYTATEEAVPTGLGYVAMGHIHAPQPVPHANVPAHYAGSLLQLDFGEAGEEKRVVMVDVEPGRPASVRSLPLTAGRRLVQATGTWDELAVRSDLADAYLDLTVRTDGPDAGLGDRAQQAFPHLVKVRAEYPRADDERPARAGRPWDELYADYHEAEHGVPPAGELMAAFRDVLEEVEAATA